MPKTNHQKARMSSEERRASIVDAACKLFAQKGFRGATTRELAASLGVTEPVLYEHFRTKRDLYSAIIESKAHRSSTFITALDPGHQTDDRAFFTALGDEIVEWYTGDPAFVRLLMFSTLENHELKDLFHEKVYAFFGGVSQYIARRTHEGGMRAVDAEVAARTFFGMIAHYALTGLLFGYAPFTASPKEVVRTMVDIFLRGLKQDQSQ